MKHAWWQYGVIYQIYPRSFQDSNDDGVGDLNGILARLDYLAWLGIDAVWISPTYPSPMADFGYDVSNYCDVDPVFGTLQDFDTLVTEVHRRDLKLILDFVPNHSSNAHPWFQASRSSRANAKRDWYIWRDPSAKGGPPTNWLSEFGGSAWTLDTATGQYYYHAYLPEQPDLNWRNPQVRAAMYDVLRFWLDRGVDGFRVDAIHMLVEDETLVDNPPNRAWRTGDSPARRLIRTHTSDRLETHAFIAEMRRVVDEYSNRVLIGEAYLPIPQLMMYYGESLGGFNLPFNFHLISAAWNPRVIAALVVRYEQALPAGGWPNWVLGNHDKSRVISRLGSAAQARLAAMLLLTLRGTPTLYNGDEIGMADGVISPEQVQDPWEKRVPGLGLGRDPCRTPMQWSSESGAGFSRVQPWLPISESFLDRNVDSQHADPASMLTLYRQLLALRRIRPALAVGEYRPVESTEQIYVFERIGPGERLAIALNFGSESKRVDLSGATQVLLSTHPHLNRAGIDGFVELQPFEGVIAEASM